MSTADHNNSQTDETAVLPNETAESEETVTEEAPPETEAAEPVAKDVTEEAQPETEEDALPVGTPDSPASETPVADSSEKDTPKADSKEKQLPEWVILVGILAVAVIAGLIIFLSGSGGDSIKKPADNKPADTNTPPPAVSIDYSQKGITDKKLASLVETGKIPADVTHLTLNDNLISDLSPLAGLPNLRELHIGKNKIEDLSPIASMTGIGILTLSNNKIKDITPLQSLNKLTVLDLSNNKISNINPLSSVTSLKMVILIGNERLTDANLEALRGKLPGCIVKNEE